MRIGKSISREECERTAKCAVAAVAAVVTEAIVVVVDAD